MLDITKIKAFIGEFKDLIIVITKFLGALATALGLITSLYLNFKNSARIQENEEQLQVKKAQIEVLQSINSNNNSEKYE